MSHRSDVPIALAGMPAAGKTTLGRALAARLGRRFIDLDDVVAHGAGMPITAIFAAEGEAGFRTREAAAVATLVDDLRARPDAVVALGGGTLVDPANRAALAAVALILVLDAPIDVLAERLAAAPGERPLLGGTVARGSAAGDSIAGRSTSVWPRLGRLHGRRRALYGTLPWHVETGTDRRGVDATVDAAAALVEASAATSGWASTRAVWVGGGGGRGPGAGGGGHRVVIGRGLLHALGAVLRVEGTAGPVVLVSDTTVAPLHAADAAASLAAHGLAPATIDVLPAGEAAKCDASLLALWNGWQAAGLDRTGHVVALGGGALTDVTGFAAATYLRGVAWTAVPTTLLGMVDAAVGGKTGINLAAGKNLAGAFHPPRRVIADIAVLATLPADIFAAGLAEVVKAAVIGDGALLETLEARAAAGYDPTLGAANWPDDDLVDVIARAVAVKALIVHRDPREREGGRRVVLNLGHTFAHGIEKAAGYGVGHGQAVAVGLVMAARLAERIGVLVEAELPRRLAALLADLGLPTDVATVAPTIEPGAILAAMAADKKGVGGRLRFVLPVGVGDVRLFGEVRMGDVEAVVGGQRG